MNNWYGYRIYNIISNSKPKWAASYKNARAYASGAALLGASAAAAFLGYVLPAGVMSHAGLSILSGLLRAALQTSESAPLLADNLGAAALAHLALGTVVFALIIAHASALHADIARRGTAAAPRAAAPLRVALWKDAAYAPAALAMGALGTLQEHII